MAKFQQTIAVPLLIVLAYTATASAQVIVIRTGRTADEVLSTPLVEGKLTFALPSGEKITVPIEFVDIKMTRAIERVGVPTTTTTQPNTSSAPSQQSQQREILLSPSAIETAINSGCQAEWSTNFQMQAFCRKQQAEAVAKLRQRLMTSGDRNTIRQGCVAQWSNNFMMWDFCEEQQLKALSELGR